MLAERQHESSVPHFTSLASLFQWDISLSYMQRVVLRLICFLASSTALSSSHSRFWSLQSLTWFRHLSCSSSVTWVHQWASLYRHACSQSSASTDLFTWCYSSIFTQVCPFLRKDRSCLHCFLFRFVFDSSAHLPIYSTLTWLKSIQAFRST